MRRPTILSSLVLLLVVAVALASASGGSPRGFVSKRATTGRSHWRPLSEDETRAWANKRNAGEQPLIKAYIALKENEEGLQKVQQSVEATSNPAHPHYGRHLSWDELNALVAPRDADVEAVVAWLQGAGVTKYEVMASRSWVRFAGSADALEALVNCRVRAYTPRKESAKKERIVIQRCEGEAYEIPRHLDHIIDFVTPIVGTHLNLGVQPGVHRVSCSRSCSC
jgi:subtilase family serine protease